MPATAGPGARRPALILHLFAVEPDLVIGAGLRQQVLADGAGEIVGLLMVFGKERILIYV